MIKNYVIKYAILLTFLQIVCAEQSQCQIPKNALAHNLLIKLHPSNETVALGTLIEDLETIHIECNNELEQLRGPSTLLCYSGRWNDDFPTCIKYCDSSLIQGHSTRAICNANGDYHLCPEKIPPNTEIQFNCNRGYKSNTSTPQKISCLPDGTFSEIRLPCSEDCGRVVSSAEILSVNGITTKASQAPWNAAIYELGFEYTYICGGSIVSPRVIISAAHCFYDHSNNVKKVSSFQAIAGNAIRNYTTSLNDNKQIADVAEVHIPSRYIGNSNKFYNDIAIVILKTPLEYNDNVSAICIPNLDDHQIDEASYVESGLSGLIAAFGQNNQLETLKMFTQSYRKCNEENPIAKDKFCISNNDGGRVCRSKSGSGFVTETMDKFNQKVYKLQGVISNTPSTKYDCTREDSKALVAVTSMSHMSRDFVQILFNAINEDKAEY